MLFVLDDGRQAARCDRCGLLTPVMHVTRSEDAALMMRAAGWVVRADLACCPRCHGGPAIRVKEDARSVAHAP
jgi:hypothetical protein